MVVRIRFPQKEKHQEETLAIDAAAMKERTSPASVCLIRRQSQVIDQQ
jgi:hypothetical protein